MKKIVITRHNALIEYLLSIGMIHNDAYDNPLDYEIIPHVEYPADIRDKDVIGVLPLWMAALTRTMTVVDMQLPKELYGKDLSLEQMKKYIKGISTYRFFEVDKAVPDMINYATVCISRFSGFKKLIYGGYGFRWYYDGGGGTSLEEYDFATPEIVSGKNIVCSDIPLSLGCLADRVAVIPLHIPFELRGKDLSYEELQKYSGKVAYYRIEKIC